MSRGSGVRPSSAADELTRLEHQATLGRLASAMLHDISQPTSTALFLASAIARNIERLSAQIGASPSDPRELRRLKDELARLSEDLGLALTHLRDLVQDAKAIGRSNVALVSIDLNEVVTSACRLMRHALDSVSVRTELAPTLPKVSGNRSELVRVLINLIDNAAHAVEAEHTGAIVIRTHASDFEVVLEVEDNGHGIPEAERTQVFDPFFSTRSESGGMGLGLWVSSRIAKTHGGELCYEAADRGALFRLSIPLACTKAERRAL